MQCEVIRPFMGEQGLLHAGQLVDASTWRNRDALIAQRYLKPAKIKKDEKGKT